MWSKLIVIASIVGSASAACPNSCSGHGSCSNKEVCTCYDNWGTGGGEGGDCSDRICPYELAWVDSPSSTGATHQYAECAAKGICDRETGQCECLPGYSGKGCGRQTCPDDCSGHGTCAFMSDLSYGAVFNDYYDGSTDSLKQLGVGAFRPRETANSWDSDRARACVCDGGWSGINCAARQCPHGNDAMDSRTDGSDTLLYQVQQIQLLNGEADRRAQFELSELTAGDTGYLTDMEARKTAVGVDFADKTFALTFTSALGESFTTMPIKILSSYATTLGPAVESALKALPNYLIDDVTATAETYAAHAGVGINLLVTFKGDANHGNQNLLEVSANPCLDGCYPKITGMLNLVSAVNTTSSVTQKTSADYQSYECGRRGKCDYDVGVCSCFDGFTGESCSTITALV